MIFREFVNLEPGGFCPASIVSHLWCALQHAEYRRNENAIQCQPAIGYGATAA